MFPRGSGVFGYSEVRCKGNETGLSWCKHMLTTEGHLCRKGEEAGVICKGSLPGRSCYQSTKYFKNKTANNE